MEEVKKGCKLDSRFAKLETDIETNDMKDSVRLILKPHVSEVLHDQKLSFQFDKKKAQQIFSPSVYPLVLPTLLAHHSPLSMCVSMGRLEMLKAWKRALPTNTLQKKRHKPVESDCDGYNNDPETLLDIACMCKNKSMVKWLVRQGLPQTPDSSSITIALENKQFRLAKWLFLNTDNKLNTSGRPRGFCGLKARACVVLSVFLHGNLKLIKWFIRRGGTQVLPHVWTQLIDELIYNDDLEDCEAEVEKKIRWLLGKKKLSFRRNLNLGIGVCLITRRLISLEWMSLLATLVEFGTKVPKQYRSIECLTAINKGQRKRLDKIERKQQRKKKRRAIKAEKIRKMVAAEDNNDFYTFLWSEHLKYKAGVYPRNPRHSRKELLFMSKHLLKTAAPIMGTRSYTTRGCKIRVMHQSLLKIQKEKKKQERQKAAVADYCLQDASYISKNMLLSQPQTPPVKEFFKLKLTSPHL